MEIWDTQQGDLVILGSKKAWKSDPEVYRKVFEREAPRADLVQIGLRSPESVWARQLASQRTAHAVAGDGAVQSDEFPVLEYQAPRAFFIGAHSYLLLLFDERTWQSELATPAKQSALRGLSPESVQSAFTEYLSVNGDLSRYIRWRFPTNGVSLEADLFAGNQQLPCIFRPKETVRFRLEIPPNADPIHRGLLEAEHALRSKPEDWRTALASMAALIEQVPKKRPDGAAETWSVMYFINVAARTALGNGETQLAGKLIRLGLERDSTVGHLRYLARVFEREAQGSKSPAQSLSSQPR